MPEYRVSDRDLDRWVAGGAISPAQRDAIVLDLHGRAPSDGLTLVTILYYAGGLLVLVAYGVFLALRWEDIGDGGRLVMAALSLVFFWTVSTLLLRTERYRLPGELLQIMAVATVPLTAYALLSFGGIWPEDPGLPSSDAERLDYQRELAWARMAVALPSVVAAALAFWMSRSPYVLVALLVGLIALALDVTMQARGPELYYDWHTAELLVVAWMGMLYVAAGVALRGSEGRVYSFWLYVTGIGALAVGLGGLAFPDHAATGWAVLWIAASVALIVVALVVQERLLAAAGVVGIIAYLAKLVIEVFESANAALAMAGLGLIVLGLAMVYQRFGGRLFARKDAAALTRATE
jgi:hypothetical protein